jgi:hypothetical protein
MSASMEGRAAAGGSGRAEAGGRGRGRARAFDSPSTAWRFSVSICAFVLVKQVKQSKAVSALAGCCTDACTAR